MRYSRIATLSILFICILGLVYLYIDRNPLVSEWNQFEMPSRAVTEIAKITKELNDNGKAQEVQSLLGSVYSQLDLEEYNAKDKERLCKLYDKYNLGRELRGCYRDVINADVAQGDLKAWIRVAKKQLEYNIDGYESDSIIEWAMDSLAWRWQDIDANDNDQILMSLYSAPVERMDEQDQYQIAKTLLKYHYKTDKAKRMLKELLDSYDGSLASKAYFVLARHEIAEKKFKNAFHIYSDYITRFENNKQFEYFVSKAHQRLLQISGYLDSDADYEQRKVELIAHTTETSDLRSYFDVARKLADQDLLAEARSLYVLGINQVQLSKENYELYQRVRLYSEIIRTGNEIGVEFDLHDGYIKKVDGLLEYGLHAELASSKELRYLYSQYLLWSAGAYRMHEQRDAAMNYYGRFIATYPSDSDYQFALYNFLRLCAQTQCNKENDMISVSMPLSAGNWSKTAIGTFSSLMAEIQKPAWKGEIEQWIN